MRVRMRSDDERGVAVVELALCLPVLVFLAAAAVVSVRLVLTYSHLSEVSAAGVRYATRAALDPSDPGAYRLRPTAEDVEAYVHRISEVPLSGVTVVPDPSTAYPGTQVRLTVTTRFDAGPLGRALGGLVNGFAAVFGAEQPFPPAGLDLSSTAVMREE